MMESHSTRVSENTPYARLMDALNLPYEKDDAAMLIGQALNLRQSYLSDAVRRGGYPLPIVFEAAAQEVSAHIT